MKKIFGILLGVYCSAVSSLLYAAEKFEVLPDLPEPLAAAQASSVSTTAANDALNTLGTQSVGHEPSLISMTFSLIFVVLLIYITGIIYAKLNKFGFNTLKKQAGDLAASKVAVVSTTALGNNKSLHVVELDGKRMLIGSSSTSINLIKDLGSYPPVEVDESAFSKIEIPNIRIPKIEIPKIEFPNIGFTKASPKFREEPSAKTNSDNDDEDKFVISDIYEEDSADGIIDKLFKSDNDNAGNSQEQQKNEHTVDPDEYELYKKYL